MVDGIDRDHRGSVTYEEKEMIISFFVSVRVGHVHCESAVIDHFPPVAWIPIVHPLSDLIRCVPDLWISLQHEQWRQLCGHFFAEPVKIVAPLMGGLFRLQRRYSIVESVSHEKGVNSTQFCSSGSDCQQPIQLRCTVQLPSPVSIPACSRYQLSTAIAFLVSFLFPHFLVDDVCSLVGRAMTQ